ncbi:gliding motility protein GldN [Lacihabitans sp. LS3-19]|uniref:type IX secretion system ring protein PorN/GldN n=1 Tax=Lacihabitans sp. LS3-19 TaxID=2487335 RepID=UPI0020CCAA4C|nr:gliding motility protein GldN [Lacihabitans sp. LS3-19]MCP9770078.1 gliding motility protein GldN [Lacihabitans sp. LS3-19]
MKKITVLTSLLAFVAFSAVFAQEKSDNGINPLSLRPVHESNVMYKLTLWRRLDLNEKANQPLFAKGTEITKHLIDGVKAGVLEPYDNDSVSTKITLEEFTRRLTKKFEGGGLSKEEIEAGFGSETSGEDDGWGGGGSATETTSQDSGNTETQATSSANADGYELFASDLYIIEVKEDWIFDKQRSRQYFDIQTITIKIPADLSSDGLEKELASFKYKELESYFRLNPNCIWYNAANTAQHKNLADAFELRLFNGRIIKKSNALNKYLDQVYKSPKEGLQKSQQLEYELLEWENNLWEY